LLGPHTGPQFAWACGGTSRLEALSFAVRGSARETVTVCCVFVESRANFGNSPFKNFWRNTGALEQVVTLCEHSGQGTQFKLITKKQFRQNVSHVAVKTFDVFAVEWFI